MTLNLPFINNNKGFIFSDYFDFSNNLLFKFYNKKKLWEEDSQ